VPFDPDVTPAKPFWDMEKIQQKMGSNEKELFGHGKYSPTYGVVEIYSGK